MPSAKYETEVAASPELMISVITDFDSYARFLPEIEGCEAEQVAEDEWNVRFTVKVVKRLRYTLRIIKKSPTQVRWHLVDGAFKSNDGGWDLLPLDDGTRTRASYFIDLQIGMFVPSSIMRTMVERSLPETISRFKEEAERRSATS